MKKHPVGIVGFRGYSGEELQRYLRRHPGVEVYLLEHRAEAGSKVQPRGVAGPPRIACSPEAVKEKGIRAVLLATPPEVSMELAPAMLSAGAKVVDLSGAFRLATAENYRRWYKDDHAQTALLKEAVYSIPEFHREKARGARLISNPGCYPTAANLALKPLVDSGVIDRSAAIVCDAKSGVSGAGRKPSLKTHFCEVTENFSAYSFLDHRHVPEVLMVSGLEEAEFSFVAQLIPIHRGILETIYFRAQGIHDGRELVEIYAKAYAGEPFVRVYEAGHVPDLQSVTYTNYCDLGVVYDAATRRAVVVSAIDNLGKGAAGQAIQNLNLALGWEESTGLAE